MLTKRSYFATAKVQNICNLIGREERSVGNIVLSTSVLYFDKKKLRAIKK